MLRRACLVVVVAAAMIVATGCRHNKVQNPLANVESKQPDKVLYDRAMDAMKHAHYDVARTLLETLINTYPDSEYIARAKLSIGDAWYAEGGTVGLQQAEAEYKDFETFFPNLPEASEAQLKVADIQFQQMEKPDRDFTHAIRAEEEYRNLIQQYPDSPLVPKAKQRLREVQEVLAQRQFDIAHFYYMLTNYSAAQARLQSLIDSYPLYSGIDEALYTLGGIYEKEAAAVRNNHAYDNIKDEAFRKRIDAQRERFITKLDSDAIAAYSKIITRYPATDRAGDARKRLAELNAPIPTPTPEALAESKAEEASRGHLTRFEALKGTFEKRPDVSHAPKVGDPNMNEEEVVSAAALVKQWNEVLAGAPSTAATHSVGVEAVGSGKGDAPGPNQPAPGSASAQPSDGAPPPEAPAQENQIPPSSSAGAQPDSQNAQAASQAGDPKADPKKESSSQKKKGKKGLRKLIPF